MAHEPHHKELLQVDDEVIADLSWMNTPPSFDQGFTEGMRAKVVRFREVIYGRIYNSGYEPGVYNNHSEKVTLLLEDGRRVEVGGEYCRLADEAEYARRLEEFLRRQRISDQWRTNTFIRELPETKFWEGDFVHFPKYPAITGVPGVKPSDRDPYVQQVLAIAYDKIGKKPPNRMYDEYSIYRIARNLGMKHGTREEAESDLTLVERGPVWKFYHDEQIDFDNLEEEAYFFMALGHAKEMRNPEKNLYKWTLDEAIAAVQRGYLHGFSRSSHAFLGTRSMRIGGIRFKNEELGRRVAEATLEGFEVPPLFTEKWST